MSDNEKSIMNNKPFTFIVLAVIFGLYFGFCGDDDKAKTSETSALLNVGDEVYITTDCFGAVSEAAYDEFHKYVAANDKEGVRQLLARGYIVNADSGQKGKLIAIHLGSREVRMNHDQRIIWLDREMIAK